MSETATPPFDEARAHRWFAVEANNLGWDLLEAVERSTADTERMIHAAHAAWFHWKAVGTVLNELRAEVLLAAAYTAAGRAEPAVHHADRAIALLPACGDTATSFDRATAMAAGEAAYRRIGHDTRADELLAAVRQALATIDDADDREVVLKFFPAAQP